MLLFYNFWTQIERGPNSFGLQISLFSHHYRFAKVTQFEILIFCYKHIKRFYISVYDIMGVAVEQRET